MGLIIALSGVDGSGKTTTAKLLMERMEDRGFNVAYHHELDFILLKPVFKLSTALVKSRAENFRKHVVQHVEQHNIAYTILYYLLVWLDNLICHLFYKLNESITIFDRCIYDFVTAFKYLGFENKFMEKLFFYFPRPDIIILLDAPPKITYLRKKSSHTYTLEYYRKQREAFLDLAHQLKFAAIIDTNRSCDEIVDEIMDMISSKA